MIQTPPPNLETLEQTVRDALRARELDGLRLYLADQYPADIGYVLERLDDDDKITIFHLLPSDMAADVLNESNSDAVRELLSRLSSDAVGDLLDQLPEDDVVRILTEDVPDRQADLLAAMEPEEAEDVRELLQFPPQSAGRLMVTDFVELRPDMTVAATIELLRRVEPEMESLRDLYVLDGRRHLLGVVLLRKVIVAPAHTLIRDIMDPEPITVAPETDQEEVARLVSRYNLLTLPVVRTDGRMVGIITVDDVLDVLVQEGTEDTLRFAGIEGAAAIDEPYFTTSIFRIVRRRVGWLLLLFLAETLTGSVLRVFEAELDAVVALAFFIPLLIGTGGNTGAQTVSTLIRGLALGEIRLRDTWRILGRELGSGFLLGALLGAIGFIRAMLWGSGLDLSLVVALTLVVICTWANTIGSLIPLAARRFGVDPAIVSAPLITTLVDATGLAIYLMIAKAILGI